MAENANGTAGIALAEEPRIPPGPSLPATVQGLAMLAARRETTTVLRRRYGSSFTMRLAPFGNVVVISDPALVKQLFMTKPAIAGNVKPNLGRVLGNGSVFNLDGEEHRQRRRGAAPIGRRTPVFARSTTFQGDPTALDADGARQLRDPVRGALRHGALCDAGQGRSG